MQKLFHHLGQAVGRWPLVFIVIWLAVWAAAEALAPRWSDLALDQEFGFLPADAPSRVSEELFNQGFPEEKLGSSIVLVIERPEGPARLQEQDRRFIVETLEPGLRQIAASEGGLASERVMSEESPFDETPATPPTSAPRIIRIRTPVSPGVGALLTSADGHAWLVVMELANDMFSNQNWPIIEKVEELIRSLESSGRTPAGTRIHLTGSAVLGRDRNQAQLESAHATERWTVILVMAILLILYRAPLLTIIPLLTVFMAVRISLHVLSLLAEAGYVTIFEGLQIYVTIVSYGAGVDYCVFLTARYQEESQAGLSPGEAMAQALRQVGGALTASAATVMGGIGMMVFADFGKFYQAGIAMPLGILMVLLATLTFSASLMRLCGRWAFWPGRLRAADSPESTWLERRWQRLADALLRRPGTIWLATVALMTPCAVGGFLARDAQSFDMVSGLPDSMPSVQGVHAMVEHFPDGLMGPVAVLLVHPQADFARAEDRDRIATLTESLAERRAVLQLADIRSLTAPLGVTPLARERVRREGLTWDNMPSTLQEELLRRYTADFGGRDRTGARIELIMDANPFARESLDRLNDLETSLRQAMPAGLKEARLYIAGTTASLRDLRTVKEGDQQRIEALVVLVVFLILWTLLRGLVVSLYLILSVLFSYLATLGATHLLFWLLAPGEFAGLDWKVGIFLFTILIAVGEDYNIFLLTRVHEEQDRLDRLRGIAEALIRTGPVISSCGLIMAGTFAALMTGTLEEMKQLGFALSFGVLLDTFVVRPVLVPAFLIGLERWYGRSSG